MIPRQHAVRPGLFSDAPTEAAWCEGGFSTVLGVGYIGTIILCALGMYWYNDGSINTVGYALRRLSRPDSAQVCRVPSRLGTAVASCCQREFVCSVQP